MSAEAFTFQKFSVEHDRCSMRVGTDGILLGCWVDLNFQHRSPTSATPIRILDVGTGSGLIALILAQRTEAIPVSIDAIDIDAASVQQARENISRSPWQDRVAITQVSWQNFHVTRDTARFDLIVCNPPFFESGPHSKRASRRFARHSVTLDCKALVRLARQRMSPAGRLALVFPYAQASRVEGWAAQVQLQARRRTSVRPLPDRKYHRMLLEFAVDRSQDCCESELTLETCHHQFSPEYAALVRDFYLRFRAR